MRHASWLFLPAAALLSLAVPSRALAQSKDELTKFQSRETAVWESVKSKQVESIRKVFLKDYIAVYDAGIIGRDEEIDGISKMTLRDFRLTDVTLRHLDGTNIIVTSRVVVDGDMDGKSISGTHNSLTLWRRVGNQWYVAAHTGVMAR